MKGDREPEKGWNEIERKDGREQSQRKDGREQSQRKDGRRYRTSERKNGRR